jgi:hypothetical protein
MNESELSEEHRCTLAAAVERILPSGDGPGAAETGVAEYVEGRLRCLRVEEDRKSFEDGLDLLQSMSRDLHGENFATISAEQRDTVLDQMRQVPHRLPRRFLGRLVAFSIEAFLGDPVHGGNRDGLGWIRIGFEKRPVVAG